MVKKKGLGRGLDSLFGGDLNDKPKDDHQATDKDNLVSTNNTSNARAAKTFDIQEIDIELIVPNIQQPRKKFDPTVLQELSDSIKTHGIITPLIVSRDDGKFILIAGERRFRASKLVGLKNLPCIVKEYNNKQIKEISLIDNIQREDLNAIEIATYLKELIRVFDYTQDDLAQRIGKSRSQVTNLLRLLNLNKEVQRMIVDNLLSVGHARCLIVVKEDDIQLRLANTCVEKNLSVREFENLIKDYLAPKHIITKPPKQEKGNHLNPLILRLQTIFDTKVAIEGNDKKGRICIDYKSSSDLERLSVMIGLLESL